MELTIAHHLLKKRIADWFSYPNQVNFVVYFYSPNERDSTAILTHRRSSLIYYYNQILKKINNFLRIIVISLFATKNTTLICLYFVVKLFCVYSDYIVLNMLLSICFIGSIITLNIRCKSIYYSSSKSNLKRYV